MLEQRFRQIKQVADMLRASTCFRRSITDYIDGGQVHRPLALSERIIEWVFGARAKKIPSSGCCNSCDAADIKKRGRAGYLARIFTTTGMLGKVQG
jgi:hypothetical protein